MARRRIQIAPCSGCGRKPDANVLWPDGWTQTGHTRVVSSAGRFVRTITASWCTECQDKPNRVKDVGGYKGCVAIVTESVEARG